MGAFGLIDVDRLRETLEAISSEAHELAKSSNPAKPLTLTKAESLAVLVERLSDTILHVLSPDAKAPVEPRPPLPDPETPSVG